MFVWQEMKFVELIVPPSLIEKNEEIFPSLCWAGRWSMERALKSELSPLLAAIPAVLPPPRAPLVSSPGNVHKFSY